MVRESTVCSGRRRWEVGARGQDAGTARGESRGHARCALDGVACNAAGLADGQSPHAVGRTCTNRVVSNVYGNYAIVARMLGTALSGVAATWAALMADQSRAVSTRPSICRGSRIHPLPGRRLGSLGSGLEQAADVGRLAGVLVAVREDAQDSNAHGRPRFLPRLVEFPAKIGGRERSEELPRALDDRPQVLELELDAGRPEPPPCSGVSPYPVSSGSAARLNFACRPALIQSCSSPIRSAIWLSCTRVRCHAVQPRLLQSRCGCQSRSATRRPASTSSRRSGSRS